MATFFSKKDRDCLERRGISVAEARRQHGLLKRRRSRVSVVRPCTPGDGIERLTRNRVRPLIGRAHQARRQGRFSWFVPASGAASRLFTSLIQFDRLCRSHDGSVLQWLRGAFPFSRDCRRFFLSLPRLALVNPLKRKLAEEGFSLEKCLRSGDLRPVLEALLSKSGLHYPGQPKALIPFHWAGKNGLTSFDEHILETRPLADGNKRLAFHFTVPPNFRAEFRRRGNQWVRRLRQKGNVDLRLTYSVQSPASDTLALDKDNRWARRGDGRLLFRPGGHGALLSNLEKTNGDIVFIKNIDNVPTAPFQPLARQWRLILAGKLIELQDRSASLLSVLGEGAKSGLRLGPLGREGPNKSDEAVTEAEQFIRAELGLKPRRGSWSVRRAWARDILSRPWRVCGMVPNKGEPGGGPFWVKGPNGPARQIVEASQLSPRQKGLLKRSTHFNPVDMVVGLRDATGKPHTLLRYCDRDQVILSHKHFDGREIWTLEHPGLWNGSMAGWNTVFVEIPNGVFHPVKTITDLLNRGHRRSGMIKWRP